MKLINFGSEFGKSLLENKYLACLAVWDCLEYLCNVLILVSIIFCIFIVAVGFLAFANWPQTGKENRSIN